MTDIATLNINNNALTKHQSRIVDLRGGMKLCEVDDNGGGVQKVKLGARILLISLMVGVKEPPDDIVIKKLIDIIKYHYMDFFEGEMDIAFEYNHVGKLGEIESHYGTFGTEYFCKVMNSYRAWRNTSVPVKQEEFKFDDENRDNKIALDLHFFPP